MSETRVLEVKDLAKTFFIGFRRKRVEAVRGISFDVRQGEIFGLLGPNGAGKTTTIKMAMSLIFPSAGSLRLLGEPVGGREARKRVGYLPENPYVYQYLKPLEFLDLCVSLVGMPTTAGRKRAAELLEEVGLGHAMDRPIGKFSKGMMQRVGLAQALLHDPELLVLDEPMSGLDPIGRKAVRDLIVAQRKKGKTIIFSSHILSDAERLCDRMCILAKGKVAAYGRLDELLKADVRRTEIELEGVDDSLRAQISALALSVSEPVHGHVHVVIEGDKAVPAVLTAALQAGAHVLQVTPHRETLEDLFVRKAVAEPE